MSSSVSLWETFAQVPDPRDASGRRHPLQAVLTLTSVAILSGGRSLYAIAQFGRDRGKDFAAALGFTRGCTPCCATLHYLFKDLDRGAFEAAIRRWARGRCESAGWEAVHVDGKTLRGTAGHEVPGVHVLAAYAHGYLEGKDWPRDPPRGERLARRGCNAGIALACAVLAEHLDKMGDPASEELHRRTCELDPSLCLQLK